MFGIVVLALCLATFTLETELEDPDNGSRMGMAGDEVVPLRRNGNKDSL